MQEKASHWSQLISKVIEKVIDKDVAVTYTFDNLEINVTSAHGPGGREWGGAKWVVDGKITIATTSLSSPSSSSSHRRFINIITIGIKQSNKICISKVVFSFEYKGKFQ